MTRVLRVAAAMICCAFLITGCSLFFKADVDPLAAKLSTVKDGAQTVPLRDVTDFEWDEVHLFNEYASGEAINKIVGHPVIGSDFHSSGSLLIFEERGTVVRKVTVTGDYLRADGNTFGPDVVAVPMGNGGLRLENPA